VNKDNYTLSLLGLDKSVDGFISLSKDQRKILVRRDEQVIAGTYNFTIKIEDSRGANNFYQAVIVLKINKNASVSLNENLTQA
jgi:uncharacterized membrane protein